MITPRLLLRAVLYAIAAMLLNVAVSVLWVLIYSVAIEPGHDAIFYEDYAAQVAPISSVVAGIPILFAAGFLIARRRANATGLIAGGLVGLAYALIDLAILLSFAAAAGIPWGLVAISLSTKLIASAAGGYMATRKPALDSTGDAPI